MAVHFRYPLSSDPRTRPPHLGRPGTPQYAPPHLRGVEAPLCIGVGDHGTIDGRLARGWSGLLQIDIISNQATNPGGDASAGSAKTSVVMFWSGSGLMRNDLRVDARQKRHALQTSSFKEGKIKMQEMHVAPHGGSAFGNAPHQSLPFLRCSRLWKTRYRKSRSI